MASILPPTEGVTTPPRRVLNCDECKKPLGLYYADCPVCYIHAYDYSLHEYYDALDGDA